MAKKNAGSEALYLEQRDISQIPFDEFFDDVLENFKPLLFCSHTFGVRRSIDILGSANQPGSGSGTLGPTEDV